LSLLSISLSKTLSLRSVNGRWSLAGERRLSATRKWIRKGRVSGF